MSHMTDAPGAILWGAIEQNIFREFGGPVGTRKLLR